MWSVRVGIFSKFTSTRSPERDVTAYNIKGLIKFKEDGSITHESGYGRNGNEHVAR